MWPNGQGSRIWIWGLQVLILSHSSYIFIATLYLSMFVWSSNFFSFAFMNDVILVIITFNNFSGTFFHGPPDIYHCLNSYPGLMKSGMIFTVEPCVAEGRRYCTITLVLFNVWSSWEKKLLYINFELHRINFYLTKINDERYPHGRNDLLGSKS